MNTIATVTTSKRTNSKPMQFDLEITVKVQPLILLINPSSFEMKYTPKITEQRVRWQGPDASGSSFPAYIFHMHQDELDVISCSGKSAMFMDQNGLTRTNRTNTIGYQNIERLVAIYRNNGMNLNSTPGTNFSQCAIDSVGRVSITYDNFAYKGNFQSFNFNESDDKPFNVDFSFDFKVTRTFSQNQISGWL